MIDTTPSTITKRALLYLRVSSAQQADKDFDAEGYSIPAQREACQREAAKLGAEIADEYTDRGESATTAKRPALRAMLDRVKRGDIDFVIVHKVDRLARNRADDVEIVMAIRENGAQLVSVTENIDETPSGLLLHGIMSSMAEFFSRNLAAEVKKGSTQKAKAGGTPYKPPLGYLNTRTMVEGREVRTVTIDPEYAPLMREAFNLYASGDYSLSELAALLEDRGLRTRATRKLPAKVVAANKLHALLRNPYYIGIVNYAGKSYQGRHEPLIDEATFLAVQDVLTSNRVSGERSWRHFHYLRGSIYCNECGRRMIFTKAKGRRGGVYDYLVCGGRQHANCTQRSHRVEAVEIAVENHYPIAVRLSKEEQEEVRTAVREHVGAISRVAEAQSEEADQKLKQLDKQERKLLTAHYADRISESVFASEQERISRERVGIKKRLDQIEIREDKVLETLELALSLMGEETAQGYLLAGPQERRLFNQGIFDWLRIDGEQVADSKLAEPFIQLRHLGVDWEGTTVAGRQAETPGPISKTGGLNVEALVPLRGFEPRFLA